MSFPPELPLFKRELIGLLRQKKAFWILLVFLATACWIPLATWPQGSYAAVRVWQTLGAVAAFFMAQLTTAIFLVPAFTAGAISGEREQDTYDALYTTLLRPATIILSKIAASAGYVLLLVLAAAPAAFVLFFLGGISLATLLQAYAVLVASLIMSAIVCIRCSQNATRTAQAAVRGYVWVILWNGGFALAMGAAYGILELIRDSSSRTMSPLVREYMPWLAISMSPFSAIQAELFGQGRGGIGISGPWPVWLASVTYSGLVGAVHFLSLLRSGRSSEIAQTTRRERRALARGEKAPRPIRRPLSVSILGNLDARGLPVLSNPVFLKEIRSEFFGRLRFRRMWFWIPFLIMTAFVWIVAVNNGEEAGVAAVPIISLTLILILVPAVAASGMTREREQGNLDFLRSTRLSFAEIARGKLAAAAYSGSGILGAFTLVFPVAMWLYFDDAPRWSYMPKHTGPILRGIAVWGVVALTLGLTACLATAVSTFARKTLTALVATYLTLLALLIGWPMLLAVSGGGSGTMDFLSATHPYVSAMRTVYDSNLGDALGSSIAFCTISAVVSLVLGLVASGRIERGLYRDE